MTSSSASGEIILFKKKITWRPTKEFPVVMSLMVFQNTVSLLKEWVWPRSEGQRACIIVSWVAVTRHYANTVKIKALLSNSDPLKSHDLVNQRDLRVMQVSSLNQPFCPFSSSVWKKCCHTLPAETKKQNTVWAFYGIQITLFGRNCNIVGWIYLPDYEHERVFHVEANFSCITQATTSPAWLANLTLEHFCGLACRWHVFEISLEMGWRKIIH